MLTASSGALVPKATMVSPTISGAMPSASASREAPFTNSCAPTMRMASPARMSPMFCSMSGFEDSYAIPLSAGY